MPTATLDPFALDLARATAAELTAARAALLARIDDASLPPADLDAALTRADEVAAAIAESNDRAARRDAARAALAGAEPARSRSTPPGGDPAPDGGDGDGAGEDPRRSVITVQRAAAAVAASPGLRDYHGGKVHIHVPGQTRAVFDTTGYPSAPTRVPGFLPSEPDRPTTLLDIIDRQGMTTNGLEYVQETSAPDAAAEVTEGANKPEATFGFSLETANAATIAHWVNITRQALEDEAQIEGYVRGRLARGLLRRVNAQILNGNGTLPNLRGILNTTGIGSYVAPADEDPLVSVRKARTIAELSEYAPDTVVLNPVDWERIELSTDLQGRFQVVTTVAGGAVNRLWGLIVIVSTNIAGTTGAIGGGGRFLVGGFREGATLWERSGIDFYVTDSHASQFIQNILTLLCELRAALTVWRPAAFVAGTFDDGV